MGKPALSAVGGAIGEDGDVGVGGTAVAEEVGEDVTDGLGEDVTDGLDEGIGEGVVVGTAVGVTGNPCGA
ncbi:MAG: hypothetical protein HND44_08540 [Chloroflexi bacterium]|nr:hypothetical protein [Ardenticatenaceae bacterium]NOG34606.1 hypothetical protein [Chloroflexota bacterium]